MGLSASQARMLSLTSRLSDLELQAQNISNAKLRLSTEGTAASQAYSDALDKQTMKVYTGVNADGTSSYMNATAANLTTYQGVSATDKQRFIKNASGEVLVNSTVASAYTSSGGDLNTFLTGMGAGTDQGKIDYYTNVYNQISENGVVVEDDSNMNNSDWLQAQITAGNLFLYTYDPTGGSNGTGDYVNVSWTSGDSSLQEQTDSNDTAKAEAQYESTMADIQAKDNRFDLQLKNIDTEHTAVQTEIDSVSKVIDKNIERSFKIFNA